MLKPITDSNGFVGNFNTENMYTCLRNHVLKIVENTAECVLAQD